MLPVSKERKKKEQINQMIIDKSLLGIRSLRNRADVYYIKSEYDRAIEDLKRAYFYARLQNLSKDFIVDIILDQVYIFTTGKYDYNTAKHLIKKAMNLVDKSTRSYPRLLNLLGSVYYECERYDRAMLYRKKAISIYKKLRDWEGLASTYHNIAVVYHDKGMLTVASDYYKKSYSFFKKMNNLLKLSIVALNLGRLCHDKGDLESGLKYYKIALNLAQKINLEKMQEITLGNIGVIYADVGDFDNALQYFRKSLLIGQKVGDDIGCGIAYIYIGKSYTTSGELLLALKYLKWAENIFKKFKLYSYLSDVYSSFGNLYLLKGRTERAHKFCNKALVLARKVHAVEKEIIAMKMIGRVLLDLARKRQKIKEKYIKKAILHFKKSIVLARKANLKIELVASLDELVRAYEKIGKDNQRQKYLRLKLKISKGLRIKI